MPFMPASKEALASFPVEHDKGTRLVGKEAQGLARLDANVEVVRPLPKRRPGAIHQRGPLGRRIIVLQENKVLERSSI